MRIISDAKEMHAASLEQRAKGASIGLVPTMGFFHEGHISLMRKSAADNDFTITSLFVNPTQFGPEEDLERYPRDMERDTKMAGEAGVDVLFTPDMAGMYPPGYRTYVKVEEWSSRLCGVTRPIHFRGVATICLKLFNICAPSRAYFGLKDAQQCLVIKKMVSDLNVDLEIVPMPTVREPDGLAMSSRNVYLTPEERKDALRISQALSMAREMVAAGENGAEKIKARMKEHISVSPLAAVDYIETVSTETLQDAGVVGPGTLIAAAVFFGKTRLIDNIII